MTSQKKERTKLKSGKRSAVSALSVITLVSLSACPTLQARNITVISPENSGGAGEKVSEVESGLLLRKLSRSIRRMNRVAAREFAQTAPEGWELKRVTLGLELEAETELAEILEIGGEAAVELRYERIR